jgi:hypothetical protein
MKAAEEECDGADDVACPGRCTVDCRCAPVTTTTTTPTLPGGGCTADDDCPTCQCCNLVTHICTGATGSSVQQCCNLEGAPPTDIIPGCAAPERRTSARQVRPVLHRDSSWAGPTTGARTARARAISSRSSCRRVACRRSLARRTPARGARLAARPAWLGSRSSPSRWAIGWGLLVSVTLHRLLSGAYKVPKLVPGR